MKKFYYDPSKYKTYLEQLGIKYPTVRTARRAPMQARVSTGRIWFPLNRPASVIRAANRAIFRNPHRTSSTHISANASALESARSRVIGRNHAYFTRNSHACRPWHASRTGGVV